jgi:hypothetical protein
MASRTIAGSLCLAAILCTLIGCSENNLTGPGVTKLVQSQACFSNNCHQNAVSPGTGNNIAQEWMLSVHNTSNAAGCADCHDPAPGHPNSCNLCHGGTPSGAPLDTCTDVTVNPDSAGKCNKCHCKPNIALNLGVSNFTTTTYDGVSLDTMYQHYSTGHHGNFVATNYQLYCRKCHNPHDTTTAKPMQQQWARSGHGSTTNIFVTSNIDFKTRGSALPPATNYAGSYCVRCHTTTGYINFVTSGFTNLQSLPDLNGLRYEYPTNAAITSSTYQDTSREMINCDSCHSDGRVNDGSAYSGRLRNVPAVFIYYPYSSPHPAGSPTIRLTYEVQYYSLNDSNICMPCHSGRDVGNVIKAADTAGLFNYVIPAGTSGPSGITPHEFASGANLQGQSGFLFFDSSMYTVNPSHSNVGIALNLATEGPCIVCHMTNDRSHYFSPVNWGSYSTVSSSIKNVLSEQSVCSICHYPGTTVAGADPNLRTAAFMNTERDSYRAAVLVLNGLLMSSKVNGSSLTPNNNWKIFGNYTVAASGPSKIRAGAYTMGAYFNYSLFFNDPAGYTHNPIYSKQLIYDSIDWLVDNSKTFSPGANPATVYAAVKNATMPTLPFSSNGLTYSGPYTTDQALNFICKGYQSGDTTCVRY